MEPSGSFSLLYTLLSTNICKAASVAVRLRPCCTDVSPMVDQPMAEITSLLRRDKLPQFHLYFLRVFDSIHKTHAVYQADTVGVCYDCRLSKYISHNQIRTLTSYPWKL